MRGNSTYTATVRLDGILSIEGQGIDIGKAGEMANWKDRGSANSSATAASAIAAPSTIRPSAPAGFAGLAIGLTFVVIHLVGINITGTSVNPARSIGPALVGIASRPEAAAKLWLFIIAPLIGAGAAGFLFQTGGVLDKAKA
jgi:Major intrinsic protein